MDQIRNIFILKNAIARGLIILFIFMGLLISISAYADVYHFHFGKPKKDVTTQQTDEDEEEVSQEEPKQGSPPPQTPTKKETLKYDSGQQPVIINNTNNISVPPNQNTEPDKNIPPLANPPLKRDNPRYQAYLDTPSRAGFKFGLSGILMKQEFERSYVSGGRLYSYESQEDAWGGMLSIGYNFSRMLGVNLYGGLRHVQHNDTLYAHIGTDLELMPIHIPLSSSFDLLDFGFLVGLSNTMAAADNHVSAHVGSRLNVNFSRDFGFTASARANLGYWLFESGFIIRL